MKNDLLFYYFHNHWANVGITVVTAYGAEDVINALTKL
jgi:hypothetical protein